MTIPWCPHYRLLPVLAIVFLMMTTGCASVFQQFDERMQRNRFQIDYEDLDRALAVYDEGDYRTALTRFTSLAASSASPKVRRKAWLGEICCHLMMAQTAAAHTKAIGMWHEFTESLSHQETAWDPVLIEPLIVRRVQAHRSGEEATPPAPQPPAPTEQPRPATTKSTAAAAPTTDTGKTDTLPELKKRAEQAAVLQHQLDAIMTENRSLKEKIKALEAIDQNIQKKKTEIAEPGEQTP